ncbi:helix-turn-helix transcriptional regulator [Streptomyces sp. OF3]|uniref:Helix-turn-helix transcriptional regulator n=1 Tax=Streptomyces alkaliterrae TaxID=2213162 RepID=A0A7W3ZKV9_9ACTN|nr:helix-turn-helix transcriptional regulator [Streptomyces alkaliterrae]MBB1251756.1 helix-turn-helix transcriptional regulator [Streptomyces alkaliterrae]
MSDDKRRPRPAAQYGPTAETVARNVKRLREGRGMTIYAMSGALGRTGRPITPSAIAKIEKQQRQVTVDDLTALAEVLDVSPATLLLPAADKAKEPVQITPETSAPWQAAWRWVHGQHPLAHPPVSAVFAEGEAERHGWPERLSRFLAENQPYFDPGIIDEVARVVSARIKGDWHLEIDRNGDNTRGTLGMRSKGHSGMPQAPEVETETSLEDFIRAIANVKGISREDALRQVYVSAGIELPESSDPESRDR